MRQDSPITVPLRRGSLRRIPILCKILALGLAVSMLASGRSAQAAPRGTAGSLVPQKSALDALAGGDVGQRGVPTICPEPPGVFQICAPVEGTDCITGTPGEECWPTIVSHVPAGPQATACTCAGPGTTCGPVSVFSDPFAGLRYTCDSSCPTVGEECLIFVNGVSTGSNFIAEGDPNLNIDDTITCECPPPTYENWVIADDFCVEGCDKCQCDVNGDDNCDDFDLQFWQDCFTDPTLPGCRDADVNCDGVIDQDDNAIILCLVQNGTVADCCPGAGVGAVIDRIRWYGSYFDPDFEPPTDGTPPLRRPDSWLIAIHTDIPATPCPPPPPGAKAVDWCGELEVCLGTTNLVFRPEGSAFTYSLDDPNNLLAGFGAGDQLRICGHQPVIITPPCANTIGFVVIDAVSTCQSKVSRPDRLIAQWVIPDPLVTVDPTGKAGWDNHRIFCYTADLGCLVHNFSDPGEIDSMGNFHPIPGKTYWISIQAAVGHTVLADCTEFATGNTVLQDYWGWHTTPPGYQHKDDAYMGQLAMGCEGEWLYNWMSHLHSSQPPFKDCADDPTKSIDMAFYLIDAEGACSVSGNQCQIDTDCPADETCITSEVVHWCQPVNPGPPIIATPVPAPTPNDAIDELTLTIADLQVNLDAFPGQTLNLRFEGPTVVWRGIEHEDIGRSHCRGCWATEMVSMDLSGFHPDLGNGTLRVTPLGSSGLDGVRSTGTATPVPGCNCWDGDWDLNVEVEFEDAAGGPPLVAVVRTPIHLRATLWEIPPSDVTYVSDGPPVDLIDRESGDVIGTLKSATHFIPYKGGVNIHSDVDWANTPTEPCCEPVLDGSGCEQVVCPDPLEECVPVEYACTSTCLGTTTTCTTDADCGPVPCVRTCIVTDCDCQRPDKCHAFADTTLPDPVFCVNSCPPGQVCERVEIDIDGDGIPDRFRCRCVEDDPLFCPLVDPTDPTDPCRQLQVTDCITDVFNSELCLPRFMTNASGVLVVADCDCFEPDGECGPIAQDPVSLEIFCTGLCLPPQPPGDCLVHANGVSLGVSSIDPNSPLIPANAFLNCDCKPTPPNGACCLDADSDGIGETCIITSDTDCATQGGTYHGDGTICGTIGACCLDTDGDGRSETCIEMDSTCCDDAGGSFLGTGSVCEGDLNGNGIDDACDCDVLPGERIILRSGNGAVGGFDTAITVLQGTAAAPLSAFPFTLAHFFHACALGPASVIAPNPAWLAGSGGVLPSDPLAQWIGPNPSSAGGVGIIGQPASALFCQPFDVCCPDITTATITISFAADDQVGDIPFGPNNVGVFINGTPQPGFSGVGFGSQITISGPAVGLTSGPNNLQVYLRDVFAVGSGLIYSVTINVDCAEEACCLPDGTCEDLDPCCCADLGGLPQGTGSDCTTAVCDGDTFCPLPSPTGVVDPCDGLQLTDCLSDNADQLCLPVCFENEVQLDGTVVPIATKCDCIDDSGDCGPVKIQTIVGGTTTEFVCDPKNCADQLDECWIHVNGSPSGASSIPTSDVPVGSEVKCKCSHTENDPCPTVLSGLLDTCAALQATDCIDGVFGETCLPLCVSVEFGPGGFGVLASKCDCVSGNECGPVRIQAQPAPAPFLLVCDPTVCQDPDDTCQIHINGSPTGSSSVASDSVALGAEIKCKCASTPFDPCPTEQAPALDPCGPLQATDCADGVDGDVCRPICVDVNPNPPASPIITATSCDCVNGDECGPVRVLGNLLICDPTVCPTPGDMCSIHINGSPTGQLTFNAASLAANSEAKCKCSAVINDPCPTPSPPTIDPCGPLQATDCIDGVLGETCLPVCMQVVIDPAVGPVPVATACDCFSGDECGPVQTINDGITVRLICEPNVCQDPNEECQIHVNGSPTGSGSIDVADVPDDAEVKCKCSSTPNDPCPTPLPPSDDPCGTLQPTDCADGVAGELCLPICLVIEDDGTGPVATATKCDCAGFECGPILIDDFPGGQTGLRCNPVACPTPGDECQPHVNGVAQGASSVIVSDLVPGDEVKCKCPSTIVPPIQAAAPHNILKNRYISVDPSGGGINPSSHHIRVMVDSSLVIGQAGAGPWWASDPIANTCVDCVSIVTTTKPAIEPDWTGCPTVHLTGCPIIPTTIYAIAAESGGNLSIDGLLATQAKPGVKWHGDCVGFFDGVVWTPPNGTTSIDDAVAAIKTFQNCNAFNAAHLSRVDLEPNLPGTQINIVVNINDVFVVILGFQGFQYPNPNLNTCP